MIQLAFINGIQCLVSEGRADTKSVAAEKGYTNQYFIRHSDDGPDDPATVELEPISVNFWGSTYFKAPFLSNNQSYAEIKQFEKAAKCPKCGEEYNSDGEGHDYDAVCEYDLCTECLGGCPYCDDCVLCGEEINKQNIISCPECGEKFCHSCYDENLPAGCGAHAQVWPIKSSPF
ncbi:hypothetical protein FY034_17405 (plasmid) [Trichlorobacter lovleyi]|uniref:LPD28 domain-containing protein n=1 Tax=Trichlorobacter lovleyi TaxID=313985 RepID=UPI002240B7F0|nr:LPD28 domain-containing protein [Trichlorobacter lovleyi]QOX80801.1 hypothetical protein FY034_17405 [Trichlorobacter lovleyi]